MWQNKMKWTKIGSICNILKLIYTQPQYIQRVVLPLPRQPNGTSSSSFRFPICRRRRFGRSTLAEDPIDFVGAFCLKSLLPHQIGPCQYHSLYIWWLGIDKS